MKELNITYLLHEIPGNGKMITSESLEWPIFLQQGPQRRQGLSPSLTSPTIDQTAGTFPQARHISKMVGIICSVNGYPVVGSSGCMSLGDMVSYNIDALGEALPDLIDN